MIVLGSVDKPVIEFTYCFLCWTRVRIPPSPLMKKIKDLVVEQGPMTVGKIMMARKAGLLNDDDILELTMFLLKKGLPAEQDTLLTLAILL